MKKKKVFLQPMIFTYMCTLYNSYIKSFPQIFILNNHQLIKKSSAKKSLFIERVVPLCYHLLCYIMLSRNTLSERCFICSIWIIPMLMLAPRDNAPPLLKCCCITVHIKKYIDR